MTTLAILPPPLRRLFSLIDFAPQPKSVELAHLFEYWRDQRGTRVLPPLDEIDKTAVGTASSRMFIYRQSDRPRDYTLVAGRQVMGSLLGSLDIGDGLSEGKNRRIAARLRRLFDFVREAGEPVVAEFPVEEGERRVLVEVLAAPLAEQGSTVAAIFGGIGIRPA